jgi:hypothetical protein
MMTVIDLAFTVHVPARRRSIVVVARRGSAAVHVRTAAIVIVPVLCERGKRHGKERQRRKAS